MIDDDSNGAPTVAKGRRLVQRTLAIEDGYNESGNMDWGVWLVLNH